MRRTTLFLILLAATAAIAPAQQGVLPSHFGSWSGQPDPNALETEAPIQWVNLWKEAGRTTGEYCRYSSGGKELDVSLQSYRDPSGAYEYYTSQLNTGMNGSTLGPGTAVDKDHLLALLGNYVVSVSKQQNISEEDLALLIKTIKAKAMQTPLPPIRSYLPSDGLMQGTQRYALGPAGFQVAAKSLHREAFAGLAPELGFSSGAEIMMGSYWFGRGPGDVLLLVAYPTPQLAEQHLRHLHPLLAARLEFAGTVVERKASLLSLVLSASSPAYASRLRASINYDTDITWNEPTHTLTDPSWFLILKTIFYATFGFCVFALIAGIAYGAFRLLIKRIFPNRFFDRPNDMEVLQLGLGSKQIDTKDFY